MGRAGHAAANQRRQGCGIAGTPSGRTSISTARELLLLRCSEGEPQKPLSPWFILNNLILNLIYVCVCFAGTACCSHMREEHPAREGERKEGRGRKERKSSVSAWPFHAGLHPFTCQSRLCAMSTPPPLPCSPSHRAVCERAERGDLWPSLSLS